MGDTPCSDYSACVWSCLYNWNGETTSTCYVVEWAAKDLLSGVELVVVEHDTRWTWMHIKCASLYFWNFKVGYIDGSSHLTWPLVLSTWLLESIVLNVKVGQFHAVQSIRSQVYEIHPHCSAAGWIYVHECCGAIATGPWLARLVNPCQIMACALLKFSGCWEI